MKAYMVEMSCNQLVLINSAPYMLIKISSLTTCNTLSCATVNQAMWCTVR